ncbi:hypothetical protein CR513_16485, partial [Mucuna pruriens]
MVYHGIVSLLLAALLVNEFIQERIKSLTNTLELLLQILKIKPPKKGQYLFPDIILIMLLYVMSWNMELSSTCAYSMQDFLAMSCIILSVSSFRIPEKECTRCVESTSREVMRRRLRQCSPWEQDPTVVLL